MPKRKKSHKRRKSHEEKFHAEGRAALKFKPVCGKKYTTNVYNQMLVKDCESITDAERKQMWLDLVAKGQASANAICSLNPACPHARLVAYQFTRIVCDRRLWEVDVRWTFVCEK